MFPRRRERCCQQSASRGRKGHNVLEDYSKILVMVTGATGYVGGRLVPRLLAKGYRLKEIARQAGFADEFHLSKTFKQMEGMSPRAYRQRALAEGEGTPPGGADAADLP